MNKPRLMHGGWAIMLALSAFAGGFAGQLSHAGAQSAPPGVTIDAQDRALIERGRTQLKDNKFAAAAATLTRVVENEKVPPEWMAIAFFYRGIANRMNRQPEAAIADFVNAVWFNLLPDAIVAQAYFHRAHAYATLGKFNEALADFDRAQEMAPNEKRIAEARKAVEAMAQSDVTGTLSGQAPQQDDQNSSADVSGLAPSPFPNRPPSVVPAPPREANASDAAAATTSSGPATTAGVQIQLGALANRALAESTWTRVSEQNRDLLGRLQPAYEEITKDGQRITRLRAGPAQSLAEARALCSALNRRGQDCIVIPR